MTDEYTVRNTRTLLANMLGDKHRVNELTKKVISEVPVQFNMAVWRDVLNDLEKEK